MRHLCDSNVLVAAVAEGHPHHESTLAWLETVGAGDTVAVCRQTQLSFLRLLTTEAVMKEDVQSNAKAIGHWQNLMLDSRFEFIRDEPAELESHWFRMAGGRSVSPKTWMDAYLAAWALALSSRFVTYDKGFEKFRASGIKLLLLS